MIQGALARCFRLAAPSIMVARAAAAALPLARISRWEAVRRFMTVQLPPFQVFFDAHCDDVYRFVRALVGPVDADDVFQETFLAALRAYPSLADAAGLRSWVFTIARRKAIDEFRGAARRALPTCVMPDVVAAAPPADAMADLWDDVRALPAKQRAAVVHRYVHDLPYDEIGALLDCSAGAARRSVHEGIRKLRTTWRT